MSTHDEAPRRQNPIAGLVRAADRALPNPILAIPVLLLGLGLLALAGLRVSGDTYFDLVSGRDIIQHGLPHADRLMAFTAGRPWSDQQWLAHLTTYGLYALGGIPLVVLTDSACFVLALSIAMLGACRLGGSPTWVAAVASPLMLVLVPSTPRAQTYALPLFAALIWLLSRDARARDRHIWLVLPLLALWANVHGSVLLGSGLVLLRCAVALGTGIRARDVRSLRGPLVLAVGAVLMPFASPYGLGLIRYYRSTATNGTFHALVTEWAGTTLRAWPVFFLFAALTIVAMLRPEIRLGLFDKLCLGALLLIGLDTSRNVVWLPLAAVVLLPGAFTSWAPESHARSRVRPVFMIIALVGAGAVGVLAARVTTASVDKHWPIAQGAAIAKVAARDPSLRIMTQETYADWLLWRHPELRGRIAFDIRFELLGSPGLKAVAHLEDASGPTFLRPFSRYRLQLWDGGSKPELVAALRAEPGARVLSRHTGVYAILRPPSTGHVSG